MVKAGARWFWDSIGVHPSNNPFHKGILSESKPPGPKPKTNYFHELDPFGIQTTGPQTNN